jgi:UV DNA damage endonuclease
VLKKAEHHCGTLPKESQTDYKGRMNLRSKLGLCCHYLVLKGKGHVNQLKLRLFQLGRFNSGFYSEDVIKKGYLDNVDVLLNNLPDIFAAGYTNFRFPSGIFPLFDRVPEHLWNNEEVTDKLSSLGDVVREYNVRATFHPGQFCSLSSDNPDVIKSSIVEVNHHAWIFDCMGLPVTPYHAINVHGGKSGRPGTLIESIGNLSDSARGRLTLENDETSYSAQELMEVHEGTGVPIVWDSHHHSFRPGTLSESETMEMCIGTWGNVRPLQHISNSRSAGGSFQQRRSHSDYIEEFPDCQWDALIGDRVDIDIEAKMKNLAIDGVLEWIG